MLHKFLFKLITCHYTTFYLGGSNIKAPAKAAAPISENALDVSQAGRARRRNISQRQGLAATILAGGNPGLTSGKEKLSGGS